MCVVTLFCQFCLDGVPAKASQVYSFKDLEKLILEKDVSIEAVNQRLNAAQYQLGEIKSSLGPELTSRYTYYPQNGSFGDDEEIDTEHRVYLRLRQDILNLLKVRPGLVKEGKAEIKAVEAELEEAKRRALYEFRREYLEVRGEKVQADFYLQLKNTYQSLVNLLEKRYRYKEGLLTEVLKAEKELIEADNAFLYHMDAFKRRKHLLAESLGIEEQKIEIDDIDSVYSLPSEDKLIEAALRNRGEIKYFKARALQKKERVSTAAYEEISLAPFVGYRIREDRLTGSESGPEIGLAFSIPLHFMKAKKNRVGRLKAEENYWKSEARRFSLDIKNDIRNAYEKYSQGNNYSAKAAKEIELKKEELRIEKSKLERAVKGIDADFANLLMIEAEITRLNLEKRISQYEVAKSYYELLYQAGLYQAGELLPYNSKGSEIERKPYSRALWVWNVDSFLGKEQQEEFFISFCKTKGIKRVFLSVNKRLLDHFHYPAQNLADFITQLHRAGIKISALFGENLWIYPQNRKNLITRIQLIMEYNSLYDREARFDGIHLDIEPHALEEWNDEKKKHLALLVETYNEVKEILLTGKTELQLEVDIPAFYENVDYSVFKKIFDVVDVITVMAYKKRSPEKVIKAVEAEMQAAVEANRAIMIGLNAKDFSDEAKLEELILAVGDRISARPCFLGFSLHDFHDYRNLSGK
jgi:outer membrane protein TolC